MPSYARSVLYHLLRAPYVVNRKIHRASYFLSCHYSKNFWAEVIKWLDDHKVKIENLSDKDILCGIITGCEDEIFVNHILLLAKQYLYSSRQDRSNIHPSLEFLITGLTLFS